MNVFEMLAFIAFIAIVGSVITSFINRGEKRRANQASVAEADEIRDQIIELEDRIRVLEKIVTDSDGRDSLRRQFRDLER